MAEETNIYLENQKLWQKPGQVEYACADMRGICYASVHNLDLSVLPWDDTDFHDGNQQQKYNLIKRSNTRCVLSFEVTDPQGRNVRVYAKRCRARNRLKRLMSLTRKSKAEREWASGHDLIRVGLPTALPLIWANRPGNGQVRESYLLTLGIEENSSFRQTIIDCSDEVERCSYMKQLGLFIRQCHDLKFKHDDLSTEHVLLSSTYLGGKSLLLFHLIDLDQSEFGKEVTAYQRAHNFFQIFRSLPASLCKEEERIAFYKGYSHDEWGGEEMDSFDRAIDHIKMIKKISRFFKPARFFKKKR